jgi:hypothetical protein
VLSSCSERERSAGGFASYPDSLLLDPETVTLDSILVDSTYHRFTPTGNSRTLLLGFQDEYEAWILFQFERTFSSYDSARMELSPVGESLGVSLEFGVYRVLQDWEDSSVVWPFQDYDPTPLVQGSFSAADTLIAIDCPAPETVITEDDTSLSWNMLLLPTSGGMAKLSARESELKPTIWFYTGEDTTFVHAHTDAYVINYEGVVDTSFLWIGSGWVLRSDLIFDISMLPANSIINRAELILRVADPSTEWMEIAAFVPDASASAIGYLNTGADSTSILVTDLVQYWVSSENVGLTLKTTDETEDISRASFLSSISPDGQPSIHVTYTERAYED